MDPPSIETISKYIFQPLRAQPPPPPPKAPAPSKPYATIPVNINQDKILEDAHGPLSLVSLLRQDKHGGSLRYLPKPAKKLFSTRNPDGSITTTTMIPPHSSVEVGPGTHKILADFNDLQMNNAHTDCNCHEKPIIEDSGKVKPTNHDYKLMPFVNLQLSKRYSSPRKTKNMIHLLPVSELTQKTKKAVAKSNSTKIHPNKAFKIRPNSAPKIHPTKPSTHHSPSPYVGFPPSTNIIPAPVQSLFFDPSTFNNIDTRPGYFEAFPNEEPMNWTLRLKVFEKSQTMPHHESAEPADEPYFGIIAWDDPESDIIEPPKHVQLRPNLRYDNALHKRWDLDRNDHRGKKASVWPLWIDTKDDMKKRLVQLQKVTLAMIWDETIAMDRGTVQFLDDFFVSGDDAEDLKGQKPRVFEDDLKAVMKLRLNSARIREEVDDDDAKTIVPDREERNEEHRQRHYTADSASTSAPKEITNHGKENHKMPRTNHAEGDVHGIFALGCDVESLLQSTPAFRRLKGASKRAK